MSMIYHEFFYYDRNDLYRIPCANPHAPAIRGIDFDTHHGSLAGALKKL